MYCSCCYWIPSDFFYLFFFLFCCLVTSWWWHHYTPSICFARSYFVAPYKHSSRVFCGLLWFIQLQDAEKSCLPVVKKQKTNPLSGVAKILGEYIPALVTETSWRAVSLYTQKTCSLCVVSSPYNSHPCPRTWKTTSLIDRNMSCDAGWWLQSSVWCLKVVLSSRVFWVCMLEAKVSHWLHVN